MLPFKTYSKKRTIWTTVGGLIAIAGFFAFLAGMLIFRAFVFQQLWQWFVMPTFSTAPMLSLVVIMGLSLVFTYYQIRGAKSEANIWERFGSGIVDTLTIWFLGWLIHLFM